MYKQTFRLRNNLILNILFSFSSVTLALFGFLAVLPPASEPEASAIIDGEEFALTLTNNDSLNLSIDPTEAGAIAVAKDTIVANTNSPAGYKLYVSTNTESNDIYLNGHETNNTEDKKLTATLGTNELPAQLENNSWGYAIAGLNNFDSSYNTENPSSSSKFAAVPQKDAEQLIHDHTGRATDDETEIYFAAKANTNIAAGNYTTTILYTTLSEATDQDHTEINLENTEYTEGYENEVATMKTSIVPPRILNNIKVLANGSESSQVIVTSNAPLELTFAVPDGLVEGKYDVELILDDIAKSYTVPDAITVKPTTYTMQSMTPELCESMTLEEQKQFIDTRDNKVYWVAKLKDGNCWMTQNLDYDLSVEENQTLTPATSNVTENRTVTPANSDLATFSTDANAIYYLDGGDYYYANGTTKTEGYSSLSVDSTDRHYAQGDYYSWKAATAGQGTTTDIIDADVNESICPKGWRLPTSNSDSANYGFGNLLKQYGYSGLNQSVSGSTLLSSSLFFTLGGNVVSGSLNYQGSTGYYWSSRRAYSTLLFTSLTVSPNFYCSRYYGFSLRCVAEAQNTFTLNYDANTGTGAPTQQTETTTNPSYTFTIPSTAPQKEGLDFLGWSENQNATAATYQPGAEITLDIHTPSKTLYAIYDYFSMQNVATWKSTLTLEQQVQVKDARDGKKYWVAKLADGNIWMTQNLDYDLSVAANQTLTPETSNVTENRTVAPVSWGTDSNSVYYMDGGDNYFANGITQTTGLSSLPADSVDRHYAQGDYYSWKAATAGQGTTDIDDVIEINESICPKGWRLPTSGSDSANYSFGNLVKQYGYTGSNQYALTDPTLLNQSSADSTLLSSPLFFARGGSVSSGQGSAGYYWSSRAYSSNRAFNLDFSSFIVYPSSFDSRYFGFSLRCVAE